MSCHSFAMLSLKSHFDVAWLWWSDTGGPGDNAASASTVEKGSDDKDDLRADVKGHREGKDGCRGDDSQDEDDEEDNDDDEEEEDEEGSGTSEDDSDEDSSGSSDDGDEQRGGGGQENEEEQQDAGDEELAWEWSNHRKKRRARPKTCNSRWALLRLIQESIYLAKSPSHHRFIIILDQADDLNRLGQQSVRDLLRLPFNLQDPLAQASSSPIHCTLILIAQSPLFLGPHMTYIPSPELVHFPYYSRDQVEAMVMSTLRACLAPAVSWSGMEPLMSSFTSLLLSVLHQPTTKHMKDLEKVAANLFLDYVEPVVRGEGEAGDALAFA